MNQMKDIIGFDDELRAVVCPPCFPRCAAYDPAWLVENEMGPSSAWLAEFLCRDLILKPGMKVLDLGCGMGVSSVFLAREFGVKVWAADLWIAPGDNWRRVIDQGLGDAVYPIRVEAHDLPFAPGFFDAIVSLDAYHYFGTDEMYLEYLTRFLKPGAQIGAVMPGVVREWTAEDRRKLAPWWEPYNYTHHSPAWWAELWERSEAVVEVKADLMPDSYELWLAWDRELKAADLLKRTGDAAMLEADGGNFAFTRVMARRKG